MSQKENYFSQHTTKADIENLEKEELSASNTNPSPTNNEATNFTGNIGWERVKSVSLSLSQSDLEIADKWKNKLGARGRSQVIRMALKYFDEAQEKANK